MKAGGERNKKSYGIFTTRIPNSNPIPKENHHLGKHKTLPSYHGFTRYRDVYKNGGLTLSFQTQGEPTLKNLAFCDIFSHLKFKF